MRQPPYGHSTTEVWRQFNEWADQHSMPDAKEDWEPWWECYLRGYLQGVSEPDK